MPTDWQATIYVLKRAPLLVAGLLLIGAAGAFSFHLLLRLERAGDKSYREGVSFPTSIWFTIPRTYRRHVNADGWSMWPLDMTWLCLMVGIVCLAFGLFRLG
jgi:MFS superfamily sulfate permease-like transporter